MTKPLPHFFIDYENLQPTAEDFARLRGVDCRIWLFHGPHQNRFGADVVAAWQPLGERMRFVTSSKSGKNALDFHVAFGLGQAWQQDADAGIAAHYVVLSRDTGFDALLDHLRLLGAPAARAKTMAEALSLTGALATPAAKTARTARAARSSPAAKTPRAAGGTAAAVAPAAAKRAAAKTAPAARAPRAAEPASPPAPAPAKKAAARKAAERPRDALTDDDVDRVVAALRAHPRSRPADRDALQRNVVSVLKHKVTPEVADAVIRELAQQGLITLSGHKVRYEIPKSGAAAE